MRLIDADALIENIKGYSQIEGTKLSKADEKIIECFINHVEMLEPTIEAKPVVHGEWIEKSMDYFCSQCKTEFQDDFAWITGDFKLPNFCPECGADMRKEGVK